MLDPVSGEEADQDSDAAEEATELRVATRVFNGWRTSYARDEDGPTRRERRRKHLQKLLGKRPQGKGAEVDVAPQRHRCEGDAKHAAERRAGRKRELAQRAGALDHERKKRAQAGEGSA